jgi:regulatory protein
MGDETDRSVAPAPRAPGPITGLEPDPRRPNSVRVLVGGHVAWTVAADEAAALGLRPGALVTDALRDRLDRAADVEAAYRTVLRSVERRAYAAVDLQRRLVRRGQPREAVEAAVARAVELGLLDDEAFARHFVQTRGGRGRGPSRLRMDLLSRGIERCIVDRVLQEEYPEGTADRASVEALAEKRARQLGDLPRPVKRRRLLAFLARRGFTGREVGEIVSRLA